MIFSLAHGMQMDEKILAIQHSCLQQIHFPADIIDLFLPDQFLAESDIRKFFCRREIQGDCSLFQCFFQFHQGIGHDRTLRRMSAAVGGIAVLLIRNRMTRRRDRIQLSHQSDMRRTGTDAGFESRPETQVFRLDSMSVEVFFQDLLIGKFFITQFRMSEQFFSQIIKFLYFFCECIFHIPAPCSVSAFIISVFGILRKPFFGAKMI